MATKHGFTALQQSPSGTIQDEVDTDLSYAAEQPAKQRPPASESQEYKIEEVLGRVSVETLDGSESEELGESHEEMSYESTESGELTEATPEQLSESVPESDNAYSDLRGIEGFEETEVGEAAADETPKVELLPDAGTAVHGNQEFLPILGALASTVIPTLVSKIGPKVASNVIKVLTPRAKALLKKNTKAAGVIGTIARLFEIAEMQPMYGTESGEEVNEAVINETAAVIESIFKTDDRKRINNTTKVPWRRICALKINMGGKFYRGTGFFIGPNVLATAGHCVYMHGQGWAKEIEVIPGCNGTSRPFSSVKATNFRSTKGWVLNKEAPADYGCIVLPPNSFSGQSLGSFGFGAFPAADLLAAPVVVAGYPGDKPFAELWGMKEKIKSLTANQLQYTLDTMGGQSGSPVHMKKNGKRYVVGIHNYGGTTTNSATRITPAVFANLKAWRSLGAEQALPRRTISAAAA